MLPDVSSGLQKRAAHVGYLSFKKHSLSWCAYGQSFLDAVEMSRVICPTVIRPVAPG